MNRADPPRRPQHPPRRLNRHPPRRRRSGAALVATLLKPASAPELAQAGKITLDGDETVLQTLAGLFDDFDSDFPLVTP
nr:alkyl sulfatase C-terminal domain-containing protein [Kitasatospora sp. NRRL B-11411]